MSLLGQEQLDLFRRDGYLHCSLDDTIRGASRVDPPAENRVLPVDWSKAPGSD